MTGHPGRPPATPLGEPPQGIVLIGQWLTEAKPRLGHGNWLPWLKSEFGWTVRRAQAFMAVHATVEPEPKHALVGHVSL